jgi:hypothetical protein
MVEGLSDDGAVRGIRCEQLEMIARARMVLR